MRWETLLPPVFPTAQELKGFSRSPGGKAHEDRLGFLHSTVAHGGHLLTDPPCSQKYEGGCYCSLFPWVDWVSSSKSLKASDLGEILFPFEYRAQVPVTKSGELGPDLGPWTILGSGLGAPPSLSPVLVESMAPRRHGQVLEDLEGRWACSGRQGCSVQMWRPYGRDGKPGGHTALCSAAETCHCPQKKDSILVIEAHLQTCFTS